MNLFNLQKVFNDNGCSKVYVKVLSPNDNSKNQVYLAGSFDILNIFPLSRISTDTSGPRKTETFKASLQFGWIKETGDISIAPHAQFILYPDYPEVRFSGFLKGCDEAPSALMTIREAGRLLFLGVSSRGTIIAYVSGANSAITQEFLKAPNIDAFGVFKVWRINSTDDYRQLLLDELRKIHLMGWITAIRLDSTGNIIDCNSSNCGGYTLEAKLGIRPNGYSEPDFHGWEVKQFGVNNFSKTQSSTITLMTPEPTGGLYVKEGVEFFIRKYGYADKSGKEDRINFGGTHKVGQVHKSTTLKLELIGFNADSGKITNVDGKIALIDKNDQEAASWSFASLLSHWSRKHNLACYVPSKCQINTLRSYQYSNKVLLGKSTDFQFFLSEMSKGHIYYDPGIKLENASTKKNIKRRSQFRIKSRDLLSLYKSHEFVNLT